MKVPLLDLRAQFDSIRESILEKVTQVFEDQSFILGDGVKDFEENLASYVGTKHALGVSSGTDALLLSLMALGVGPGDVVITTDYSFFATAGVIARLGAEPVFVDIDCLQSGVGYNCNISASSLATMLEKNRDLRRRTKAIMPVHLYGRCADMDALTKIGQTYNIPIVEDAAQALSARWDGGGRAGSWGDMGCFSFFPSKNLGGAGDGGAITTNDSDLYEKLIRLRVHGGGVGSDRYNHRAIGGNFRLDAVQAAVLDIKLQHLDSWSHKRKSNAAYYSKKLKDVAPRINPAVVDDDQCFNQYMIHVRDPKNRDALKAHLDKRGVGNAIYYPMALHQQPCFSYLGYQDSDFRFASSVARKNLSIPVYPELTQEQMDYVIESIGDMWKD